MMDQNPISFSRQFKPPGMTGLTNSPANVEEVDLPPGTEGTYFGGPLANPPRPSPTVPPGQQSLSMLAAGGNNHQEAWMSGQSSPTSLPQQAPFSATESDLPPGAEGTYYGGPLANPPKPTPTPNPQKLAHFSWSAQFTQPT